MLVQLKCIGQFKLGYKEVRNRENNSKEILRYNKQRLKNLNDY